MGRRRRRRKQSFLDDVLELDASGVWGGLIIMITFTLAPFVARWLLPEPTGNEVRDLFWNALRGSWLPIIDIVCALLTVFGAVCTIVFLVKEYREMKCR